MLMPNLDGGAVIRQLRAEAPGARIIAVSGAFGVSPDGTPEPHEEADAILHKPFLADELIRLIAGLMERPAA